MVNQEDFSNIPFLVDNLPLNVKLAEGIVASIQTKPGTAESQ